MELAGRAGSGRVVPAVVPVGRSGDLPLSFAQERLWFFDQWEPGNPLYNVPGAVRLVGRVDVGALEAAFGELVRRHESLRTTFVSVDGRPVARVVDDLVGGVGWAFRWCAGVGVADGFRAAAGAEFCGFDGAGGVGGRAGGSVGGVGPVAGCDVVHGVVGGVRGVVGPLLGSGRCGGGDAGGGTVAARVGGHGRLFREFVGGAGGSVG